LKSKTSDLNLRLNGLLAYKSALETLHNTICSRQSRSDILKGLEEFRSKIPTWKHLPELRHVGISSQLTSDVPSPISDSTAKVSKDLIPPIVVNYPALELFVNTSDLIAVVDIDAPVQNLPLDERYGASAPQSDLPCIPEPALASHSSIHQSLGPYSPLLIRSFTFILVFISSCFRTSNNPLKPFGQLIMIFDPGIRTPIR